MARRHRRIPQAAPLTHLAPALVWLRDHDVSAERLADAFGTTATHVRVLDWRSRRENLRPSNPRRLGVRADDGTGVEDRPERIDQLREELELIRTGFCRVYDFPTALEALGQFRGKLGQPANADLVRLLARWHEHRAWFAVHSGFTRSATMAAAAARALYARVYGSSRAASDLKGLADAALVGSHAHLYVNEPERTIALLKVFRDASETANNPMGSDYYRQLGTAYALMARQQSTVGDDTASRVLALVPIVMTKVGEARSEAQLAFASRHHHVLGANVDVDACCRLPEVARTAYGTDSLESVIAANYCAVGQLATDRVEEHERAMDELAQTQARTARFPHQAGVSTLLSLTLRLQLTPELRRLWVSQVSYLNAYRRY